MLTRMSKPPAYEAILAAIRAVPRGQVAGYGMIARRAGLPGHWPSSYEDDQAFTPAWLSSMPRASTRLKFIR